MERLAQMERLAPDKLIILHDSTPTSNHQSDSLIQIFYMN